MIGKKFRLKEARDFDNVKKNGKVYQSSNFGLGYINREDNDVSRFGFIISTKIAKDAVDRNRFKRSMSEAVRLSTINLVNGYDVVFLAKQSITRVPTSEIMKEVQKALRETGIIK